MVNFKKLKEKETESKNIDPIKIFENLDKSVGKEYLRPIQEEILKIWLQDYKDKTDVIIKLPTGDGKTLIALLLLQSSLQAGRGPALYLCPNDVLVQQTIKQAQDFGIKVVSTERRGELPTEFLNSQAIYVANCNKLFNGFSKFGIKGNREFEEIGSLIMDDAHKCLEIIKESFSLKIRVSKNEDIYISILKLFSSSLKEQSLGSYNDIINGSPEFPLMVPFWDYNDKLEDLFSILDECKKDDNLKFQWRLLKDHIQYCDCYITGTEIQIIPRKIPIDKFPSYTNCKHRYFLSATLTEDAFLIKHLDIDENAILNPLTHIKDNDHYGERLIVIPSIIDPMVKREDMILWLKSFSSKKGEFGVVSIVPSKSLANDWDGCIITDRSNLDLEKEKFYNGVSQKKSDKILVLINQYDGIDFPDNKCRILCIDSLPRYSFLDDRYKEILIPNSKITERKLAQRIEQGFGRSIRGKSDYSIVFVIGNEIPRYLSLHSKRENFSAETKKQIEIGETVCKDITDSNLIRELENLFEQFLSRDEDWKEYYRGEMSSIKRSDKIVSKDLLKRILLEKTAEEAYQSQDVPTAIVKIDELINFINNDEEKAIYLQLKACYVYNNNPTKSNEIQKAAFKKNSLLLKSRGQIDFQKINPIEYNQINNIKKYICNFKTKNELILDLNARIGELDFNMKARNFENGIKNIGDLLGYISDTPERA